MKQWISTWIEIGYECHRDKERVPLRSNVAWFLRYKLRW